MAYTLLPAQTQVLIQLHYAGINGGCETFRVRGDYAFAGNRGKCNFPLGAEGAGVVVAVGADVKQLKVGCCRQIGNCAA